MQFDEGSNQKDGAIHGDAGCSVNFVPCDGSWTEIKTKKVRAKSLTPTESNFMTYFVCAFCIVNFFYENQLNTRLIRSVVE
jgi:hypothetical protein